MAVIDLIYNYRTIDPYFIRLEYLTRTEERIESILSRKNIILTFDRISFPTFYSSRKTFGEITNTLRIDQRFSVLSFSRARCNFISSFFSISSSLPSFLPFFPFVLVSRTYIRAALSSRCVFWPLIFVASLAEKKRPRRQTREAWLGRDVAMPYSLRSEKVYKNHSTHQHRGHRVPFLNCQASRPIPSCMFNLYTVQRALFSPLSSTHIYTPSPFFYFFLAPFHAYIKHCFDGNITYTRYRRNMLRRRRIKT